MNIEKIVKDSIKLIKVVEKVEAIRKFFKEDLNKELGSTFNEVSIRNIYKRQSDIYGPLREYLDSLNSKDVYNLCNLMFYGRGMIDGSQDQNLKFKEFMQYPIGKVDEKDINMGIIEDKILGLGKYLNTALEKLKINDEYKIWYFFNYLFLYFKHLNKIYFIEFNLYK